MVDSKLIPHDLWHQQCITLQSGVLLTTFGSHRAFVSKCNPCLTLADPYMTFDPSIALNFCQGFLLPNLVAIRHSCTIWPLVDPGWPLYDLWPQHCTSLQSGILPTKFGSHRTFLKEFDLWMTFDPWWGRFENTLSNVMGPSPTTAPSFSSIPQIGVAIWHF